MLSTLLPTGSVKRKTLLNTYVEKIPQETKTKKKKTTIGTMQNTLIIIFLYR